MRVPAPPAASPQVEDNAWTQRAPAGAVEGGPAATREENRAPQLTPSPARSGGHSTPTMGLKTAAAAALLLALVGSATAQRCQPACQGAYQTLVRCPSCRAAPLTVDRASGWPPRRRAGRP